jgi:hypothetical protein
MAKGFGKDTKSSGKNYETIFERVQKLTGGEDKTWSWYRQNVKKIALEYKKHPEKTVKEERRDRVQDEEQQDKNELRRFARQGRLFLFEYKAISKYIPYYDEFPLAYVLRANKDHFIAANLHYVHPNKRLKIVADLMEGKINFPSCIIHKYITDHIDGFLLDLASVEWETSIALPVESFVKNKNGLLVPYKSVDVWKETNEKFYTKFKAKRIIKGYGKPTDIEDAE